VSLRQWEEIQEVLPFQGRGRGAAHFRAIALPTPAAIGAFESDLDKLSNGVLDAIEARQFDEAERLCKQLRTEFPEVIDGRWRLAMLREAQEKFEEAAALYGEVLEEMRRQANGFDDGACESMERDRARALSKIARHS